MSPRFARTLLVEKWQRSKQLSYDNTCRDVLLHYRVNYIEVICAICLCADDEISYIEHQM